METELTRYGTSHETVYQLNLKPSATLRFDSLELSAMLPLSTSGTYPTYCCRTALGNATLAATYAIEAAAVRHWYEVSLSVPSSHWSDVHAGSLAATAALTRDAGYYLPDTTTLRGALGAEVSVSRGLSLGASAGVHYWLRHDDAANALVTPLTVYATWSWAQSWPARAGYRMLVRPFDALDSEERFLHELYASVAHEWSGSRVEVSIGVPLDESLRELEMLRVGVAYVRSF